MAEAEPEPWENLRRFTHRDEHGEEEGAAVFEAALRQGERCGTVIAGERTLGPELLAKIERRSPATWSSPSPPSRRSAPPPRSGSSPTNWRR